MMISVSPLLRKGNGLIQVCMVVSSCYTCTVNLEYEVQSGCTHMGITLLTALPASVPKVAHPSYLRFDWCIKTLQFYKK